MSIFRRARRRARSGGFSHVSTTLEAAAILGWFALVVTAEKKLDDAVTSRRSVEDSATATAHASAGQCGAAPIATPVGDVTPRPAVVISHEDRLGVPDLALPAVETVGLTRQLTFRAQQTPLARANAVAREGTKFTAQRKVYCEDKAPATPIPPVAPERTMVWMRNVMGY